MVTSVGLISTLAASITASFLGQEQGVEIKDLKKQTARLEALLEELLSRREQLLEPSRRRQVCDPRASVLNAGANDSVDDLNARNNPQHH